MREAAAGVVLLRHVDARGDEAFHNVKLVAPARELRGRDAALGARQAIPINPSTRVSASSTAPSVLDAALGSRDRAAVVKPVTSVSKAPASRENYAEAVLKQMQQRASAMDEVAARRRAQCGCTVYTL